MSEQQAVTLLIHCRDLPGTRYGEKTAVRIGIQEGKEVINDVPADVDSVTFTALLRVRRKREGVVDFGGPYVQGPATQRFIYLCWGERLPEGGWEGVGRSKLLLHPLTWSMVERALQTETPVEVQVSLTNKKGLPLFASLPTDAVDWEV